MQLLVCSYRKSLADSLAEMPCSYIADINLGVSRLFLCIVVKYFSQFLQNNFNLLVSLATISREK